MIKILKEGSNGADSVKEKTVYLNNMDNGRLVIIYYQRIIYCKFCEFNDGVCD